MTLVGRRLAIEVGERPWCPHPDSVVTDELNYWDRPTAVIFRQADGRHWLGTTNEPFGDVEEWSYTLLDGEELDRLDELGCTDEFNAWMHAVEGGKGGEWVDVKAHVEHDRIVSWVRRGEMTPARRALTKELAARTTPIVADPRRAL